MFPRGAHELRRDARCGKASFLQLALEFLMTAVDRSLHRRRSHAWGRENGCRPIRSPWTPAKASRAARNFPPAP